MNRIFAVVFVLAGFAASVDAQACRDGHPPAGDLGFRWLHCANGGPCWESDEGGERWFDLANVPHVRTIDPHGPGFGVFREGDMIVAVDGLLTTTIAGGRRLANLEPEKPVKLLLQRGETQQTVTIVPTARCGMIGLSVNSIADSAGFADRLRAEARVPRPATRVLTSSQATTVNPPSTPTRRSTPLLDLEFEGEVPTVRVDSAGAVTLEFRGGRVVIHPRKPERIP